MVANLQKFKMEKVPVVSHSEKLPQIGIGENTKTIVLHICFILSSFEKLNLNNLPEVVFLSVMYATGSDVHMPSMSNVCARMPPRNLLIAWIHAIARCEACNCNIVGRVREATMFEIGWICGIRANYFLFAEKIDFPRCFFMAKYKVSVGKHSFGLPFPLQEVHKHLPYKPLLLLYWQSWSDLAHRCTIFLCHLDLEI